MTLLLQASWLAEIERLMLINVVLVLLITGFFAGIALTLVRRSMRERVKAARLAAMGTATARILHQVKNPLQTILLHAEMLEDERIVADAEVRREVCEAIVGEAKRMTDLLAELSAYAAGVGRRLDLAPLPLHTLVRDLASVTAREAEREGVRIEIGPLEDVTISGDAYFLRQAFANVLRNAREALAGAPAGAGRIEVQLRRRGSEALVEFRDTGPGVDPEREPHIFEPFVTTKGKGMGLGLPICREIVEGHGGRVVLRSRPGGGTTVQVYLALAASSPSPEHQPA